MAGDISTNEKLILSLLKERQDLMYQVSISEKAIDFWDGQMQVVFDAMDENDENKWHPNYQDNVDSLANKIKALVARGKIETKTIDSLERRCEKLQHKVDDFVDGLGELSEVKKIVKKHLKEKD
jgi:hypothetical protein